MIENPRNSKRRHIMEISLPREKNTSGIKFFMCSILVCLLGILTISVVNPATQPVTKSLPKLTIYEAMCKLEQSVNSAHFSRDKHAGDDPNPDSIKKMIIMGACNPIRVYDCTTWTRRIKFVCSISPEVSVGLSLGIETENGIPLAVTAFPALSSYWETAGVAGCTLIGQVARP
jgi:hypothetical protein